MDNNAANGATEPAGNRRLVMWGGLALAVVLLGGIGLWATLASTSRPGGGTTPTSTPIATVIVGQATPSGDSGLTSWVQVYTPGIPTVGTPPALVSPTAPPAQTQAPTQVPVADTPTLVPGGATFTPVAAGTQVAGKPRVLGITAGVGMSNGDISGAAPLAVTFSDAMDQPSAQLAFQLRPAATGSFAWKANTLLFTPDAPLSPATTYTVSMSGQARAQSGQSIAAPMSANFQTAPPPAILRTLPTMGASDVPTDTIVTLTFNRPMIPLTALDSQPDPSQWVTISPAVKGRWVWLGTSAVGFRPESGFLPSTDYTVEARAGWPDASGVTMPKGVTATFTTLRPALLSVDPPNGAGSVDLDTPIVLRFNMPVEHSSTESAVKLPSAATAEWSDDSTVLTYTLKSLLEFGKSYTVSVPGKVRPMAGGAATALTGGAVNTWSFTATGPTVVNSHYPASENGPQTPSDSFGFTFNNPLAPNQEQDVERLLTINPVPQGYVGQLEVSGTSVYTSGAKLLPETTYRFELKAGLKDKWGFPVQPASWEVKIGPEPPGVTIGSTAVQLYSEGASLVKLTASNVDHVDMQLYSIPEAGVPEIILDPYGSLTDKGSGTLKRSWTLPVQKSQDGEPTVVYATIALDDKSDRLPPGYYRLIASVQSPYNNGPIQVQTLLIVGRTGAVIKSEGRNLMVWAVDLGSGKPVSGYKLRVEQWQSGDPPTRVSVKRGTTGQDGVWRVSLDSTEGYVVTLVWSDQGDDAMLASTGWNRNMYFGYGSSGNADNQVGAVYTDRPIYRPAQQVFYRGVFRIDDDALYSLPQAGATVELHATTYSGRGTAIVYTGTATLSTLGTFSGQFTLPADAPTGDYTLNVGNVGASNTSYYGGAAFASFSVEEYRKPEFQVSVIAGGEVVHGDPVTATIASSYYFGGPLSNMTTTVNLQTSPYYFGWSDPDTGESYTFGDNPPIYYYDFYRPSTPAPVQSFGTTTDANGLATVDVSRYVTTTEGSRTVTIEGQVRDLSNQAVASSAEEVVHQGSFYIGLRTSDYLAEAKQPLTVTIRTVDSLARKVRPNTPVNLHFARREWVQGQDGDWQEQDAPAGDTSVTTDANGRATYRFTPQEGGEYVIHASGTDNRSNAITTSLQFYSYSGGGGYVPWRYQNEQQVQLVADKEKYKVGDVAKILVTSPFTNATGLLTVERGHVRRYKVVQLQGGAPTVEVPLEGGDVPNVYIGLTLIGEGQPPAGAPAEWTKHVTMRQGYVGLSLDTSGKQLDVSVEPQGKGPFEPGSTASVRVTARDKGGKGVASEFSLAVVDEAIYALADDNATRLFDAFWSERGLGVSTSSSFTAEDDSAGQRATASGAGGVAEDAMPSAAAAPPGQPITGGGGEPAAPKKVRSDFRDTAFWRATVSTGADGSALVDVPLPDNLTTWRLTAQGITANTLAGIATTPMTVTQQLLLRPVQPRFFTEGDNPHPQAIIHNNTASALDVEASLVVSGAITLDAQPGAAQRLTIQPGTQAVVTWSAHVAGAGAGSTANLRYWVHTVGNAGDPSYREDAVAAHIPVEPFAAPETVATSGEVSGTRTDETIFLPYSTSPLLGDMTVQISPSLAAAASDSVKFVQDYPYDSTDMAVSRMLPLVVLEKVYNEQGAKTPFSAQVPDIVSRSIKRLQELQQPDGGWAWWELGPSSWWETGYAVQGLLAARDSGYTVPADMLSRGIGALAQFQQDNGTQTLDETYNLNMRAYSLYVLAQAGQSAGDLQAEATNLVAQAPRISNHARAWLAMALDKLGMKTQSKQVLDTLSAAARQSSTTAHWEEDKPDYWSMGTNTRATALAIDALVTISPNDPLLPKAVRWLMTAEKEGHWLSSQETSISLLALAHYIRATKELTANYAWQVSAFDKLVGSSVANSSNVTQTVTLHVPVAGMPQNTLGTLGLARSSDQGKMYYQASLRYYVPGEGIKSRSEGLSITRSYYALNGTDPVKEVAAGEVVRVRLSIVVPETSYYVMVTDPLPAGLEGVNGSLNTTSFTERPPDPMGAAVGDESDIYAPWWRWGPFNNVEMRDDRTVLFADYMAPGTYVYDYYARATTPGTWMSLPARAELLYYPDVFGHSDGGQFQVK